MKTTALLLASSAFLAAPALQAADPYVGYIYPAGIQAGTTNRLVIGGQNLNRVAGARFSQAGLRVVKIENVPGFNPPTGQQRKHLLKWLDGIAAGHPEEPPLPDDPHLDEWRSNSWWRALGTLDAGKIAIVERDLHVPKNALQSTPSLRQKLLVTVAADASAKPWRGELCLYGPNGISAPRPFEISAAPHLAEPLYTPPHRPAPEIPVVEVPQDRAVVLDGQIMPGQTDAFMLHLKKRGRYSFRVVARELQPYVGDAVPGFFNPSITLKDETGATVAAADDEMRFRPDPAMDFVPEADGTYRLEIHDVLYRGRADFVYSISVAEGRAQVDRRQEPGADGPRRIRPASGLAAGRRADAEAHARRPRPSPLGRRDELGVRGHDTAGGVRSARSVRLQGARQVRGGDIGPHGAWRAGLLLAARRAPAGPGIRRLLVPLDAAAREEEPSEGEVPCRQARRIQWSGEAGVS